MIKIERLAYRYLTRDDFALRELSLNIKKGEFVLFTGPTGCGKSTLLKCLNGIIPHEALGEFRGNVWINGMNTREHPIRVLAQQVGLVFQNPDEQIFSTRVLDEVAFGLENLMTPPPEIRARVEWALAKTGMQEFIHRSTNALSGGQKQRLAVAAALALRPGTLVLDEPISQLDPAGAVEVLNVVKKLSEEGMTIILVEHRIHEVAAYADRVIVMDGGRIVLDQPAERIGEHLHIFRRLGLRLPGRPADLGVRSGTRTAGWAGSSPAFARTAAPAFRMKEKVIEVKDLWFSYDGEKNRPDKQWALKGIYLDVAAGEIVSIMGNNGSGKTTLLHHLAGLIKTQKGSVTVAGKDTRRHNAYRLADTVGILFQNPALMLSADSVEKEVTFGPKNLRLSREDVRARVEKCLETMELKEMTDYHPQTLSGGQRLRCAMAAILAMQPPILLLDEPTSGQDILHVRKLMNFCRELTGKGRTVVFITHDHEVAVEYADRIVVMEGGQVVDDYTTQEFLQGAGRAQVWHGGGDVSRHGRKGSVPKAVAFAGDQRL